MLNLCMNLYMKFRNFILDIIRTRTIPPKRWKKTVVIRKIMRIFLFVFPFLIYLLTAFILWNTLDMTQIFRIIFIVIAIVLFILLLYIILKFKALVKNYIIDEYIEHFKNVGLINKQGNSPIYRKMKYDIKNVDQEIYYFDDVDIDYGKFSEPIVIRGLRNIFRGFVSPDEGNDYGIIQFNVIPSRKSSCRNLTVNDLWLVENCIHIRHFWG